MTMTEQQLREIEERLRAVTEESMYQEPWTTNQLCLEAADALRESREEVERLREGKSLLGAAMERLAREAFEATDAARLDGIRIGLKAAVRVIDARAVKLIAADAYDVGTRQGYIEAAGLVRSLDPNTLLQTGRHKHDQT